MNQNPTIHLKLKKGVNTFRVAQKHLYTKPYRSIRLNHLLVFWKVQNVRDGQIQVGTSSETIPNGYYTFNSLKEALKKHDITIEKLPNRTCKVSCSKTLRLSTIGTLLGFGKDQVISSETTSTQSIALLGDLQHIQLYTNLVDDSHNLHYYRDSQTNLYESHFLLTIPVDVSKGLDGVYSSIDVSNIVAPCRQMTTQEFYMDVVSGGHEDDYEIYLDLQILY